MIAVIASVLLIVIALLAASLRPIYSGVSLKELKRRARSGDDVAQSLYQVARHGRTADSFLVLCSLIFGSGSFLIIARRFDALWAYVGIVLLSYIVFIAAAKRPRKKLQPFAVRLSPYLAKLLIFIRPATNKLARLVDKGIHVSPTGLYDKDDLIELLERQKKATHNRIDRTELDLALRSLSFGAKTVHDYMVPYSRIHFVNSDDPIGPILLSELHDSGYTRFPVKKAGEQAVVGTLYLKDLVEKRNGGIVSNAMSPEVHYVSESAPLGEVLDIFLRTKHHVFVVQNQDEDMVGLITIEDVIEQIIGRKTPKNTSLDDAN